MKDGIEHPSSETLQLYAEGELGEQEGHELAHHLTGCRRCASEMEAWSLLFRELEDLPALGPSEGFRERVVSAIPRQSDPVRSPVGEKIRSLLGAIVGGGREAAGHLSPDGMQALLEGALGGRNRRRVQAHVAACGSCRTELESWRTVFQALDQLPALAPSAGFAERVMAAVEAPAPATAPERTRILSDLKQWADGFIPSSRKGWALAGAVATAPTVGMVAALVAVLAHPLLTVGDLAAFLWWRAGDAATALGGWMITQAMQAPIPSGAYEALSAIVSSPGLAAAGFAVLWSVTLAAGWVFYKNVISTYFVAGHHVR